jgi:hypothetical protein
MSVYVVVAREHDEIRVCEAYAGATHALGRAFQIASDFAGPSRTDLWTAAPGEEVSPDCSVRWVFMDTNKHSVVVFYRPTIETSIPSAKDAIATTPPMTIGDVIKQKLSLAASAPIHHIPLPFQPLVLTLPTPAPKPPYDFLDRSLPAGWKYDGKPALMSDLLDNPDLVQDPLNLSDAQKWALVTARVAKSPGWRGIPKGSPIAWFHRDSLRQLKDKSGIGALLRDGEIESLSALRADVIVGNINQTSSAHTIVIND